MDLNKAIQIAVQAHQDQKDKVGMPYITHLFSVMNRCKTEEEKICAILHDLVEDTNWTLNQLREQGFSERVVDTIRCLSKEEGEALSVYIEKVKSNSLALRIKLYDLEDNMDIRRLKEITEKDRLRLNKYLTIYKELLAFQSQAE